VEWAGHPNWYFRISKFSLPYLKHPSVPKTRFLRDISALPADLENYVLKPLYSFAGLGVVIGPTREQVLAADPEQYILQEKVDFQPVIETPEGATKAEIRVMYLWMHGPVPVCTIVRTGRGKMMGVDQNKDLAWVGASAGLISTG
jgi:glutathionylspermidine synthase